MGLGGLAFLILQVRSARDQLSAANDQIAASRAEGRSQRTRAFQERYSDRTFRSTASRTIAFLQVTDAYGYVTKIESWSSSRHADDPCLSRTPSRSGAPKPSKNDILAVFDFFEEFAAAYNRGDVEKDVVLATFANQPIQVFTCGWWFLCWRRGGRLLGETTLYEEFERLVKSLRKERPGLREETDLHPKESVRVLCLPHDETTARPDTWTRSRRLSDALSQHRESLSSLAQQLREANPDIGSDGPSHPKPLWRVVLVPLDIDTVPDDRWSAEREHGKKLAEWLSRGHRDRDVDRIIEQLERPSTTG